MSLTIDDSENDEFIIDGGTINSGETIPIVYDDNLSDRLASIDADSFETKFFPIKPKERKIKFISGTSKFISNSSEDLEKRVLREKKKWKKGTLRGKSLVDMNTTDVVKVDKKVKTKFVNSLADNITKVKNYLIDEIAPSQLALLNAFEQSNQTLESILGIKIDQNTKIIESMISDAYRLKIFYYLADVLQLTKEQKKIITDKYFVITVPTTQKSVNLSS